MQAIGRWNLIRRLKSSDEVITKWQNQDITGIKLSKNQQLSTLLFADDQVIIADTEYNLQKAAYTWGVQQFI